MIELVGKFNRAKVFTDNVDEQSVAQVIELCNQEFTKGSKIRMMSDMHAGKGCTIGTTLTITDSIVPNLVGVDIGCGMYCVKLKDKEIDFEKLDNVIKEYIPSGMNIRESEHIRVREIKFNDLRCKDYINLDRAKKSIGTLGGGNHFIEVDKDDEGNLYLVIHSGSRYLGKQVAVHYQNIAIEKLENKREEKQQLVEKLKKEGREKDIEKELAKIESTKINKDLAYIKDKDMADYLNDMEIVQKYAEINRKVMAEIIINRLDLEADSAFTTIHNYIDIEHNILRKGAISAYKDEKVLIPMNMRDGSLIAIGKGNEDWNCSAPHGAGRIMSRSKAKSRVGLEEFKESMNGIWSSSVCDSTIDESPMVYKPMEEIINNIGDTVDIVSIIKPVYNYKAH